VLALNDESRLSIMCWIMRSTARGENVRKGREKLEYERAKTHDAEQERKPD
jgi:hypothetical protein